MNTTTATPTPPAANATNPMAPPRKSRRHWYLIGGFVLLLIGVVIGYYYLSGWMGDRRLAATYAALDVEDPNWRWPDLVASLPIPPDDRNSAVQVLKVSDLLKPTPFSLGGKWDAAANERALRFRNARLSAEQVEILDAAFGAIDPKALVEARKLKDMPEGRYKIEIVANPFNQNLDYLQKNRELMNLLSHDVMRRAQEGDLDGAAESCQALLNATHSINDHPTFIGQLVRLAGEAVTLAAVERLLGQGQVSDVQLKPLQSLLQREADDNLLFHGVRGERALGHHVFSGIHDGKVSLSELLAGIGGGKPATPSFGERMLDSFPGVITRGYPDYLELMNEQVRAAKLKDAEQGEALGELDNKVRQNRSVLVRMFMPAKIKLANASQRGKAMMRTAAVAAERYRQQHNVWPSAFEELVEAKLLKEVPTDPYDGKTLRLRPTKTGIVIYAVGPDGVDDGGKLDRNNPVAPGSDIGIELWNLIHRGIPNVPGEEK